MKNELVGWDDGKIYFYDEQSKEYCVNEKKKLLDKIIGMCADYFKKEEKRRRLKEQKSG
ncbi:MAG: hypothetical protein V2A65_03520 [Candidatus Omnitrophota bacterium]